MTATWTANATDAYSYDAGTGTGSAPAAGSGLDGTTITLAANTFSEPGYTFAGWNDGAATYAAGATYTLASNGSAIVLTATWTANATDAYSYAPGTGSGSGPAAGWASTPRPSPWPPTPTPTRATPSPVERRRRHLRRGGDLHLLERGLRHRLYRPWRPTPRRLLLDAGTGSGSGPAVGCGLDTTTITLAANTYTNPGYAFAGWNDGAATYAAGRPTPLAQRRLRHRLDRPLERQPTDAYSYAPGTGRAAARPRAGPRRTTITLAANTYTNPGYAFAGWNDGAATYAAGSTYTFASEGYAIVLTAPWRANPPTPTPMPRAPAGQRPGRGHGLDSTTITLAANTFSEPGYTFTGWNDGAATYAAGATYTLASNGSAIVLTATWTANATDAYSYDAGTGTGSTPATGSGLDGTTITLAANTFGSGLHLRRLERRRRHLHRGGHLHLGQQRLGHRLDRHLDGQRHRRLLL